MLRRIPFAVLAGGLALVLVVLAVLVVDRARDRPSVTAGVPQDQPGPVLLVPGYGGATGGLEVLAARLRAVGRDARVIALPAGGTGDLRATAAVLEQAAEQALTEGAPSVDVIGYSAGGVTARLWVKELGGAAKARRVVTLGSPHHGTRVARLARTFASDACPPACRQLVPDSDLLDELNDGDETPAGPQWLALWTEHDTIVTPPESGRLEGAVSFALQEICPGLPVTHSDLPPAPLVVGLVLQALGPEPIATPQPSDCAALQS